MKKMIKTTFCTDFRQCETSVQPKTNSNESRQQNPLQVPDSSRTEIFTERIRNPSVEVQQKLFVILLSEQIQAEVNVYDYNINEE